MENLYLVGQHVVGKTFKGNLIEGVIVNRDGHKVVISNTKKFAMIEQLASIECKGRLIEDDLGTQFSSLFAPLDFKNKVKSEKDEADVIDSAKKIVRDSNEDAKRQSDEDLDKLAKNSLLKAKQQSKIEAGNSTESEEAKKVLDDMTIEDPDKKDAAIKANEMNESVNNPHIKDSDDLVDITEPDSVESEYVKNYRAYKKAQMEDVPEVDKKTLEEAAYERLSKGQDLMEAIKEMTKEFNVKMDEVADIVIEQSDKILEENVKNSKAEEYEKVIESLVDKYAETDKYFDHDGLYKFICENMNIPANIVEKLNEEKNVTQRILNISKVLSEAE